MGSVRKLKSGKWQAQFRPVPGGKQITRTTGRKVDAERWLSEQTAAIVTGQFVNPQAGRIAFNVYYEQWSARQVWSPGMKVAMDLAAGSVTFGDVPLRMLLRSHVETWVKAMESGNGFKHPLAPGTIRTRFNNVRSVLRAAVKDRLIPSDPGVDVRLPRVRRQSVSMVLPTADEVAKLMRTVEDPFRAFIGLCAFGGLRLGEAAAVKAEDIDLDTRVLRVRRQVQRIARGNVDIRPPKYGSERTVYLADGLVELLRKHLADLPEELSPWIFKGDNGNPPHQNTVGYWWRKTKRAAKVRGIRLHDLRHYFASGLIHAGCDVVTVQRALGHSSPNVTLSTYAHLWPSAEDRTRDAASKLMELTNI